MASAPINKCVPYEFLSMAIKFIKYSSVVKVIILGPCSVIPRTSMIGIRISPAARFALSPKYTAGSIEIKKFCRFISPLLTLICIVVLIGVNPLTKNPATAGYNAITAPVVRPTVIIVAQVASVPSSFQLAIRAMAIPITRPIAIGSPQNPSFSFNLSGSS